MKLNEPAGSSVVVSVNLQREPVTILKFMQTPITLRLTAEFQNIKRKSLHIYFSL
jgi:hypothetical protein